MDYPRFSRTFVRDLLLEKLEQQLLINMFTRFFVPRYSRRLRTKRWKNQGVKSLRSRREVMIGACSRARFLQKSTLLFASVLHIHVGRHPELPKSCLRTCQDVVRRTPARARARARVHSIIATTVTTTTYLPLLLAIAAEPFMNYYYYYRGNTDVMTNARL